MGVDDFQIVLERGLFITFLSFSANPNACEPGSHTPVFATFLLTAFSQFLKESGTGAYLRTLDKFLDCGGNVFADLRLDNSTEVHSTAGDAPPSGGGVSTIRRLSPWLPHSALVCVS